MVDFRLRPLYLGERTPGTDCNKKLGGKHCRSGRFERSRICDGNQTPDTTARSPVTILTELPYLSFGRGRPVVVLN